MFSWRIDLPKRGSDTSISLPKENTISWKIADREPRRLLDPRLLPTYFPRARPKRFHCCLGRKAPEEPIVVGQRS